MNVCHLSQDWIDNDTILFFLPPDICCYYRVRVHRIPRYDRSQVHIESAFFVAADTTVRLVRPNSIYIVLFVTLK